MSDLISNLRSDQISHLISDPISATYQVRHQTRHQVRCQVREQISHQIHRSTIRGSARRTGRDARIWRLSSPRLRRRVCRPRRGPIASLSRKSGPWLKALDDGMPLAWRRVNSPLKRRRQRTALAPGAQGGSTRRSMASSIASALAPRSP